MSLSFRLSYVSSGVPAQAGIGLFLWCMFRSVCFLAKMSCVVCFQVLFPVTISFFLSGGSESARSSAPRSGSLALSLLSARACHHCVRDWRQEVNVPKSASSFRSCLYKIGSPKRPSASKLYVVAVDVLRKTSRGRVRFWYLDAGAACESFLCSVCLFLLFGRSGVCSVHWRCPALAMLACPRTSSFIWQVASLPAGLPQRQDSPRLFQGNIAGTLGASCTHVIF